MFVASTSWQETLPHTHCEHISFSRVFVGHFQGLEAERLGLFCAQGPSPPLTGTVQVVATYVLVGTGLAPFGADYQTAVRDAALAALAAGKVSGVKEVQLGTVAVRTHPLSSKIASCPACQYTCFII